jgi:hypothetical protein
LVSTFSCSNMFFRLWFDGTSLWRRLSGRSGFRLGARRPCGRLRCRPSSRTSKVCGQPRESTSLRLPPRKGVDRGKRKAHQDRTARAQEFSLVTAITRRVRQRGICRRSRP